MKGMVKSRKGMIAVLLLFALLVPTSGCSLLWSYSIGGITALTVSESGDYVAVGCEDGWYYIFDTWGNRVGSGHVAGSVNSLDIADTGDLIIGFANEYTFCTVDGTQISSAGFDLVRGVSIASDGMSSLAWSHRNVLLNERTTMVLQVNLSSEFPFGAISSDGTIACAVSKNYVHVFENGTHTHSYEMDEKVKHIFVSSNGEKIILSTTSKIGYINVETEELQTVNVGSSVVSMAVTPTGDVTVVATSDKLIWLEEEPVNELDIDGPIQFLSLVDDGSLTIIGEDNIVQVITRDGTSFFTYDVESPLTALEVSQKRDLLVVCTDDSIHTFQLFQRIQANTSFIPTASRKSLPLTSPLEEVWSVPVTENSYFYTVDMDGDGFTEILCKEGTKLKLIDGNGNIKSVRDLKRTFGLDSLLDVDGDTLLEIPLVTVSTQYKFSVYDWKEDTVRDYYLGSLGGAASLHNAEVMPRAVIDSDNDGNPEILAIVGVGYSCKPRGIISIDYASGEIKWFYRRGTGPISHALADINGDGVTEIVLGSMAPCTCPDDEEYPDCDVYVTALSITGDELWKVHMGEGFRRISVSAVDIHESDGVEIVGFGYNASENWGNLFVLNCTGEYLYNHEFEYSIIPGAMSDIDGDGYTEIVAADTRGYLYIYTGDLQEKQTRFVKDDINTRARIYLNDFDGDGFLEIFLNLEREVFIFDKDLNVIWQKEFPEHVRLGIANFFQCKNTLLILSDKLYAYSYTTKDSPCPLWEITERTLTEEGNTNLEMAESAFAAGEYETSKSHYEDALDRFENLEDEEQAHYISEWVTVVSDKIFKYNVKTGIILLAVFDAGFCMLLLYYWFFRRWSRLAEGALLLTLPVLLGLFQVYHAHGGYQQEFVTYTVPFLIGSTAVVLRQNIIGFARTLAAIRAGHKNLLVLSIVKSDQSYRVSVENIEEKFNPVKESRMVTFSKDTRENLIKKAEYMISVLNQIPAGNHALDYVKNVLRETGTEIYQNVIPADFSYILKEKFLLLEVDDTEIPWELMYADTFLALKYAVSRRIVSTDPVTIREKQTRKKRALIISDPTENLPGAKPECEFVYKRLKKKIDTVLVEGYDANVRRIANLFGQGFDIIHFAGHVNGGFSLSDGIMTPQEIKEFIVGTPVVFVNGCKSEELARAFLLGGAMAYVGTIHPVHDSSAARIAADFYDLCLQHQIGEALRRAREYNMTSDLVWASLIMYGDPTLKLL